MDGAWICLESCYCVMLRDKFFVLFVCFPNDTYYETRFCEGRAYAKFVKWTIGGIQFYLDCDEKVMSFGYDGVYLDMKISADHF
jgi:hypothetical protein